mmetsp:Transcript_19827/g.37296  ORF Transcript_19827/g.37296 Transcript_19827/m.37296 type:complete len:807 (+) Transcript_19827:60-2480(+)
MRDGYAGRNRQIDGRMGAMRPQTPTRGRPDAMASASHTRSQGYSDDRLQDYFHDGRPAHSSGNPSDSIVGDMPQLSDPPGPRIAQASSESKPGLFGNRQHDPHPQGAAPAPYQSRTGWNSGADSPGGGYSHADVTQSYPAAHATPTPSYQASQTPSYQASHASQSYQASYAASHQASQAAQSRGQSRYDESDPRARAPSNWQAEGSPRTQNGYSGEYASAPVSRDYSGEYISANAPRRQNGGYNPPTQNGYTQMPVTTATSALSYPPGDPNFHRQAQQNSLQAQTRLLQLMKEAFAPEDLLYAELQQKPYQGPFKLQLLNDLVIACGLNHNSPQESEKRNLNSEIKFLHRKRAAASELLDEVEKEVIQLERILEDRKSRRLRLQRAIGGQGFAQMCCSPCIDDEQEEVNRGLYQYGGTVELRSRLRDRLEEAEVTIAERDKELRELKSEMGVVQGERALYSTRQHQMVSNVKDIRQRILRRYAHAFDASNLGFLRLAFIGWQQLVKSSHAADQVLKKGAMAFSMGFGKGVLELSFACWRQLVREVKQRQHKKDEHLKARFAAKFVSGATSASLHACFMEWHKVLQERKLHERLSAIEEKAHADMQDRMALSMRAANEGTVAFAKVTVLAARTLRNTDWWGKSDPYCICEVPGKRKSRFQTPVVKNNLNPVWNFAHDVAEFAIGDDLKFMVYDKDMVKSDHLGTCTLKARLFYPQGYDGWLDLDDGKQHNVRLHGQVQRPQLHVKVEIRVQQRTPKHQAGQYNQADHHAQAAMQAAQAAKEAADAARLAVELSQKKDPPKNQCCIIT